MPVLYIAAHAAYNKERKTNTCCFASTTNERSDATVDCAVARPIKPRLCEPMTVTSFYFAFRCGY